MWLLRSFRCSAPRTQGVDRMSFGVAQDALKFAKCGAWNGRGDPMREPHVGIGPRALHFSRLGYAEPSTEKTRRRLHDSDPKYVGAVPRMEFENMDGSDNSREKHAAAEFAPKTDRSAAASCR